MQYEKPINYLGPTDVPFKYNGQNIYELRRSALRDIAVQLGIERDGTKNELLMSIVGHASQRELEPELNSVVTIRDPAVD